MKQWYKTRKKDPFYLKAKKNDIISRAYYKLEEIDRKYNLFKNQKKILDVGCSPGGWTQYILKKNPKNKIVGIDLLPIHHQLEGELTFYILDLKDTSATEKLFTKNNYTFDSIISDIAPNTRGNQFLDQTNSYDLSILSAQLIEKYLKSSDFLLHGAINPDPLPTVIFEAIQSGDAVRAEGVMREHSNIMVEYIKVFEKRDEEVTIKDLIGYSGVGTSLQRLDAKIDQ